MNSVSTIVLQSFAHNACGAAGCLCWIGRDFDSIRCDILTQNCVFMASSLLGFALRNQNDSTDADAAEAFNYFNSHTNATLPPLTQEEAKALVADNNYVGDTTSEWYGFYSSSMSSH